MASTNPIGYEVSGGSHTEQTRLDEDGFEVIDEVAEREANLRPTVELEIQAKVDANHPDAKPYGLTLEAEERLEARELEIERTRARFDRRQDSDREARSRRVAARRSSERRREFGKRAASVDPWADPEATDPRARLSREELATVNREAERLSRKLERWSRAAVSRRLAERVVEGCGMMSAVVGVYEELRTAPGQVIPIAAVGEVDRYEVSIEGTVTTLWTPSHPKIAQVGLVEDDTGRIKLTTWTRSNQPTIGEGDRIRVRGAARSFYGGRANVAATGWTEITILGSEPGGWES